MKKTHVGLVTFLPCFENYIFCTLKDGKFEIGHFAVKIMRPNESLEDRLCYEKDCYVFKG